MRKVRHTSTRPSSTLVFPSWVSVMVCRSVCGVYLYLRRFSMCGAPQEIAWNLKGKVAKCDHREYGFAQVNITRVGGADSEVDALFEGLGDDMQVCARLSRVDFASLAHCGMFDRSGCPMEISYRRFHPTSTLLAIQSRLRSQPSRTIPSPFMVFSSIQKSHIHPAERRLSVDSY
jgi:hypothetical protein